MAEAGTTYGKNRLGIQAEWDNSSLNKGQAEYVQKVQEATGVTDKATAVMNKSLDPALQKTSKSYKTVASQVFSGVKSFIADAAAKVVSTVATVAATAATVSLTVAVIALIAAVAIIVIAIAALVAVFGLVVGAAKGFWDFMMSGEDAAVRLADALTKVNNQAQYLGQRAGLTGQQVNDAVKSLEALGMSSMQANQTVIQLEQANLGLANATDIARVAMDASVISGQSVDDTTKQLIDGISNLNQESLTQAGLQVDVAAALDTYATEQGIATGQMTLAQQQQAVLNAVIADGVNINGAYAQSMQTASAQLDDLQSRTLPDLKAALGAPFQEGFYNIMAGINGVVQAIKGMITEGGVLYPLLVELGALFSIITEPLKGLGDNLTAVGGPGGPIDAFAQKVIGLIEGMFDWGLNLITNFANGIIAGLDALAGAISSISNMIAGWFSPGSPPKIAPDIDKWGAATVNEWLKGFSNADFSMLKDIQGPLKEALSYQESIGGVGEGASGQIYADISKGLIDVIKNGKNAGAVFGDIQKNAGAFGGEIVNLAKLEMDETAATKELTAAQMRLDKAMLAYVQAGATVNKGIMAYNQMLRSGASKEALRNKLKEINAAKQAQKLAETQAVKAADDVITAQDKVDLIKEQINLQKQLIAAMMDLIQAQTKSAEKTKEAEKAKEPAKGRAGGGAGAGIKKGAGPGLGGLGGGKISMPESISNLGADIKAKADEIKAKFAEIWAKIQEIVGKVKGAFAKLRLAWLQLGYNIRTWWNGIKEGWNTFWDNVRQKAYDIWFGIQTWIYTKLGEIKTWIETKVGEIKTGWDTFWDNVNTKVTEIWNTVTTWVSTKIAEVQTAINTKVDEIKTKWDTFWDNVNTKVTEIWNTISTWVSTKIAEVQTTINTKVDEIKTKWDTFWDDLNTKVYNILYGPDGIVTRITTKVGEIKTTIETKIGEIKTAWTTFWDDVHKKVQDIWNGPDGIVTKVQNAVNSVIDFFTNPVTGMFAKLSNLATTAWNTFVNIGENIVNGIKQGLENAWNTLKNTVGGAVEWLLGVIKSALGMGSPSKVMAEIGKMAMKGLELGITGNVNMPANAMVKAINGMLTPATAAVPIMTGGSNYYQPNINVIQHINNGMGAAQAETSIMRSVKRGITR